MHKLKIPKGILIGFSVIMLLLSSVLIASSAEYRLKRKFRRKRKESLENKLSYSFSLDTYVSMDEDRDFSNDFSATTAYKIDSRNNLSLGISFTKMYPETVGVNEKEFFFNSPTLTYSYLPRFTYGRYRWNALFAQIAYGSNEAYKDSTMLMRLRGGNNISLKILDSLTIGHTFIFDKFLNKYENGANGPYLSHRIINALEINYSPIKNLSISAAISFIHNQKYGGSIYLNRGYEIGASYVLPTNWSLYAGIESGDDYSIYSTRKLEIYNRNNSTLVFKVGKSF